MSKSIEISEPLLSVLLSCEVNCDKACCGLEAFEIAPKWIRSWTEVNDPALLQIAKRRLNEIIDQLADTEEDIWFPQLNASGPASHWTPVFEEWQDAIERAPDAELPVLEPSRISSPAQNFVKESLLLLGWGILGALPLIVLIALVYRLIGLIE